MDLGPNIIKPKYSTNTNALVCGEMESYVEMYCNTIKINFINPTWDNLFRAACFIQNTVTNKNNKKVRMELKVKCYK